ITGALNKLTNMRRTIRVANGMYNESFVFADTGKVNISGEGITFANTTITQALTGFGTGTHDHVIEASGNNDLLIEGIKLTGGAAETVRISGGGKIQLFATELTGATGGIDSGGANTQVVVRQSLIDLHTDSGGKNGH